MRKTRAATTDWRTLVERSGYYPGLVIDAVAAHLGDEMVEAAMVHHDTIFDPDLEMRRHITVLLLTPTRLLVCHTDEHPAVDDNSRPHASTTTEAVKLDNVRSVALTRVVPDPASYSSATEVSEVVLSINLAMNWGTAAQIDLEPATCSDQSCEADHGYTGTITAESLTLRVSRAAEGPDAVHHLIDFAMALSQATV